MNHLACVFRRLQLARIPSFSRHTAHLSARHRRQSTPADAQRRGWVACTRGAARPTGQGRPCYPQAAGRFVAKRREVQVCPAPPARPCHLLLPAQHAAAPPGTCSRGTNAATVQGTSYKPGGSIPTRPKTRATLESSPQGARRARHTRAMAAQATRPRPHHPPGAPPPKSRLCCVVECHATRSAARLLSSMRRSHLGRRSCAAGRPIPRAGSTAGAPEPHLPVTGSMGTRSCRARRGAGVQGGSAEVRRGPEDAGK